MAKKLIITNRTAIKVKYGEGGCANIFQTLNMMVATDIQIKGVSCFVLLLDDKNQMAVYGARSVTDYKDELQVKNAIDKVYANIKPDDILLLGGSDIIPFQHLDHPTEPGKTVESDLPYACNTAYSKSADDFLQPVRRVSRLPDQTDYENEDELNGSFGEQKFISVIVNATKQRSLSLQAYNTYFAVTAADYQKVSQKSVKRWFSTDKGLMCCPPHCAEWEQEKYDCAIHYFALYGFGDDRQWYEDKEGNSPVYECVNDRLYLNQGTIVISQCSYAAQLYGRLKSKPICNVYIEDKTAAYLGSTGENVIKEGSRAEKLIGDFLTYIKNGNTISEAFYQARIGVIADPQKVTDEEKLVLSQWVLYGDGINRPITQGEN